MQRVKGLSNVIYGPHFVITNFTVHHFTDILTQKGNKTVIDAENFSLLSIATSKKFMKIAGNNLIHFHCYAKQRSGNNKNYKKVKNPRTLTLFSQFSSESLT